MLNRRDFIKNMAGLTAGSAFYPVLDPGALLSAIDENSLSIELINEPDKPFLPKTIFCQFRDEKLRKAIVKCAEEINCEVINKVSISNDILSLGGFVNIIDRNLIDRDMWHEYVKWYDEFRRDETCIIVDNMLSDMPMPSRYMPAFDLNNPYAVHAIVSTIRSLKDIYFESYRRKDLISNIFKTVDSGLIVLDHKKNIVMINISACTMLNVVPDKIYPELYNKFLSQIKSQGLHIVLKERGIMPKYIRKIDYALGKSWTLIVLDKSSDTKSI